MFAGSATILPYTPPAPGQIDPGYSFEFQFPARKVGLSDVEFVVINMSKQDDLVRARFRNIRWDGGEFVPRSKPYEREEYQHEKN